METTIYIYIYIYIYISSLRKAFFLGLGFKVNKGTGPSWKNRCYKPGKNFKWQRSSLQTAPQAPQLLVKRSFDLFFDPIGGVE